MSASVGAEFNEEIALIAAGTCELADFALPSAAQHDGAVRSRAMEETLARRGAERSL